MRNIYFTVLFLVICVSCMSQDISGKWKGEIDLNGTPLEIGFNLEKSETGYAATMDIPKQGMNGAKVSSTSFADSILSMTLPEFGISYEGKLNGDNQFDGYLSQGGKAIPLILSKGEIVLNRPQEPKKPFNYYLEEIVFANENADLNLAGTLTRPDKKGKYPVAIIVSGSGPQDRDGFMFGHKPYLLLADELTKKGIAVFRFDERGVGSSEGDFDTSTLEDFMSDVDAAISYLQSRKDIDASQIGLIGHSIGGIIAPKMAKENKDIAFVVLMAAPGVHGDVLMLSQKAAMERLMGLDEMQIAQGQTFLKGAYDIVAESKADKAAIKIAVQDYFTQNYGTLLPAHQIQQITDQITSNEFIGLVQAKPEEYLAKLTCPVLAINGSKDFQVPATANLAAIEAALGSSGNKNVKIMEFENLNHLFQTSSTGALSEYSEIEETMAPVALNAITDWVVEVVKKLE